jgi:hypothetical protein
MAHVTELHDQYVREELKRQKTTVWNRRTARERCSHRSLNILVALVDIRQLVTIARKDLELMTPRLIGKDDAIHRVYDRLHAHCYILAPSLAA